MKVKTDNPKNIKDTKSNALLANDKNGLLRHRKKLSESHQINNLRTEMNDLKNKTLNPNSTLSLLHKNDSYVKIKVMNKTLQKYKFHYN